MDTLTFAMELRRSEALIKVLMVAKRLGGRIPFVSAADNQVTLVINAPTDRSHRFAPQLRRIVDVSKLLVLKDLNKRLTA